MPRTVDNQRGKFESEEFFQKFSKESEIRYAWPKDRQSVEDRLARLQADCREGHVHLAFTLCGTNIPLRFPAAEDNPPQTKEHVNFEREQGKVHFMAKMILNGVCVRFVGVLDLARFEGSGRLEFDEDLAQQEDNQIKQEGRRDMVDLIPGTLPQAHFQPVEPGPPLWSGQDGQPPPHMDSKPVMGTYVHAIPMHNSG